MATSDVQICSNALLLLGAQTINSFDDSTERATLCGNLWANARDGVLRAHPWNCAIKRVSLAPDATAPDFDYGYQFTLPGDCLRVLSCGRDGEPQAYEIEGRKILSDENPIYLRYVYRLEDVASWDSMLVEAMTAYMAWKLAYPITKSASEAQVKEGEYGALLRLARTVDGQENPPQQAGDERLLASRR